MKKTLYPTFRCFDDAMDFISELIAADKDIGDLFIVHALCTTPAGATFAHAWVEDDRENHAIHAVLAAPGDTERLWVAVEPIADYHRAMRVQEFTRYTPEEAWRENRRTQSYGPWLERYIAFCADGAAAKATWTLDQDWTEKGEQ